MQPLYLMLRKKQYAPEIGPYSSYNIVAYGPLYLPPVAIIRDVTTNAALAYRMVTAFNQFHLSTDHLMDAIQDMLE